jgi:precorrin-8X/cobalt-precorrin-8 methylmutase
LTEAVFDQVVIVDWSAQSTPKRGADSIWIAVASVGNQPRNQSLHNPSTRHDAVKLLSELFARHPDDQFFVGVDFGLGYPVGTLQSLGLENWKQLWALIATKLSDEPNNANNRFEVADGLNHTISDGFGPFWGCSSAHTRVSLDRRKPPGFPHLTRGGATLGEFRLAEHQLRAAGHRVASQWQLMGVGSVGSQSLTGIATLERLRQMFQRRVMIWPFDTDELDLHTISGAVVVAEVWPSLWGFDPTLHEVKDAAQVIALRQHVLDHDASGTLADTLAAPSEPNLHRVRAEEGWIFGAPHGPIAKSAHVTGAPGATTRLH